MYRLSDELAKSLLKKIKSPEIPSSGENAFLPKSLNSVGIIDPVVALGTDFHYILESPTPVVYPDFPYLSVGVYGYFLYRKEELLIPLSPWPITRALIDPVIQNYEEQFDVSDCAVVLPSDTDKLIAKTVSSFERLLELEPLLIDCLHLEKK